MKSVDIVPLPVTRLGEIVGADRHERLLESAEQLRAKLDGGVVWNINATATGGGVAEMLPTLLAYVQGAGIDSRWLVLDGDAEFFAITKRIHNTLHGSAGDGGDLGQAEHEHYDAVLAKNAEYLKEHVSRGDVVVLHDPQTVGLAEVIDELGAIPVFRSHIGKDDANEHTARGWEFLRPYVEKTARVIVSRRSYAPPFMDSEDVVVIAPSIDPFATKNVEVDDDTVMSVLTRVGFLSGDDDGREIAFPRRAGDEGSVRAHDDLFAEGTPLAPGTPYVLQVSRWDRLKDMPGVMRAFTDFVLGHDEAHLVLCGPATAGVSDDPEGAEVLEECRAQWRALPEQMQQRVHLVCVPMDDVDENAYVINAMQRAAAIVIQKSLVEGFGLTVTEAMWKSRPVIASAVGGIQDQIADGRSGLLLADPTDLPGLGNAIQRVLGDPDLARSLGAGARERVLDQFLGDRHLQQYAELLADLKRD